MKKYVLFTVGVQALDDSHCSRIWIDDSNLVQSLRRFSLHFCLTQVMNLLLTEVTVMFFMFLRSPIKENTLTVYPRVDVNM